MTDVHLCLLKVNKKFFGQDSSNRDKEFSMMVQQVNASLKNYQKGVGVRMLIVPEYFWSTYDEIGHSNHKSYGPLVMGVGQKQTIYSILQEISKQAGSLVIVAGSIFYQKGGLLSNFAYNVCPVLSNGEFLLKSYKQMDDGAAGKNVGSPTFDYKSGSPYFQYQGVDFGLEICGEHRDTGTGKKRLKDWVNIKGQNIDIQIIISDSMTIMGGAVATQANGYVVQCDIGGSSGALGVYPAAGPFTIQQSVQPLGNSGHQINGAVAFFYKVTV